MILLRRFLSPSIKTWHIFVLSAGSQPGFTEELRKEIQKLKEELKNYRKEWKLRKYYQSHDTI